MNSENVVVLIRQQLILTVFSLCLIMAFVMCLWAEKGRWLMFARFIKALGHSVYILQ